jgi:hypothetical protein
MCRSQIQRIVNAKLMRPCPVRCRGELSQAEQERYKERTRIERVNRRWKDEFGGLA